ncbi:MAG: SpoIVB peptidase S55 domain-containing protein [Synergistaceae bacterium]|nr:SpoIVB peptidase S55 domain-containing protein [Synergistaceae bacterium]
MIKAAAAAAILLLVFFTPLISDAAEKTDFVPIDPVLPLSDIKPGMKAEIRTVLRGTKISRFPATLLGIVPRKTSPKNLILLRVDDPYVRANGGIAAGMSGSRVYVGGKLVGAIGYGWEFGDNNLGLVTPIEEMAKAFDWPDRIPKFGVSPKIEKEPVSDDVKSAAKDGKAGESEEKPASEDIKAAPDPSDFAIEGITSADATSEDQSDEEETDSVSDKPVSGDADSETVSGDIAMLYDAPLVPLAMPVQVDGISSRITEEMKKRLGLPLMPLGSASSSSSAAELDSRPEPGSAVGASLAWGDIQMGGIGTLTALSKDGRFIAFGHPMVGQGAVSFPLTKATILQVIPSMASSFKLGYQGPIIGIITQDRPEAIAGHIGKLAPAISYKVTFNDVDRKYHTVKRFQTVADSFTGPVIGSMGMLGIIDDLWARKGEGTAILKYKFYGGNLPGGWERRNIFFSDKDLISSLLREFDGLSDLFALNQFQEIRPFGVDLDVEITRDARVVFIEKLEIANKKDSYSPGDKLELKITLRPWRKRSMVKKIPVTVPKNAVGFCEIVVRGGGIMEPEQESLATGLRVISTLDEMLKELSIKETNNQIVAEIDGPQLKDKESKDSKENPSIEDLLDDRLQSEIKAERIKKGAMVIVDTNYYVEGLLRKIIKVKRTDDKDDKEEAGPTSEEEAVMRAEAEALEVSDEAGAEVPPETDAEKFFFRIRRKTAR